MAVSSESTDASTAVISPSSAAILVLSDDTAVEREEDSPETAVSSESTERPRLTISTPSTSSSDSTKLTSSWKVSSVAPASWIVASFVSIESTEA